MEHIGAANGLKPFLSKGSANSLNICLLEDGNVVNDTVSVCNVFNDHFSNIANDIGRDLSEEEVQNHTSVIKIREHVPTGSVPSVPFKPISERQVDKYITSIGKKKATGLDDLSAKVLKIIKKPYLCHLTRMINRMFEDSTFPKHMKNARITPIYKKEGPLLKKILSTCKCITHSFKDI